MDVNTLASALTITTIVGSIVQRYMIVPSVRKEMLRVEKRTNTRLNRLEHTMRKHIKENHDSQRDGD